MTTFSDDLASDLDNVFFNTDEFAKSGVYSDGTQTVDVKVRIESDTDGVGNVGIAALACVSMAQVPNPDYKHTITVDGVTWTIDRKKHGVGYKNDDYEWYLPLIREPRSSQWRR